MKIKNPFSRQAKGPMIFTSNVGRHLPEVEFRYAVILDAGMDTSDTNTMGRDAFVALTPLPQGAIDGFIDKKLQEIDLREINLLSGVNVDDIVSLSEFLDRKSVLTKDQKMCFDRKRKIVMDSGIKLTTETVFDMPVGEVKKRNLGNIPRRSFS